MLEDAPAMLCQALNPDVILSLSQSPSVRALSVRTFLAVDSRQKALYSRLMKQWLTFPDQGGRERDRIIEKRIKKNKKCEFTKQKKNEWRIKKKNISKLKYEFVTKRKNKKYQTYKADAFGHAWLSAVEKGNDDRASIESKQLQQLPLPR